VHRAERREQVSAIVGIMFGGAKDRQCLPGEGDAIERFFMIFMLGITERFELFGVAPWSATVLAGACLLHRG
jgi:hypothetical protein